MDAATLGTWMAQPPAPHQGPLTLPWLQDTAAAGAWAAWKPTERDVVLVDAENHRVSAYNLTVHDLAVAENYATLRQRLLDAANAAP